MTELKRFISALVLVAFLIAAYGAFCLLESLIGWVVS